MRPSFPGDGWTPACPWQVRNEFLGLLCLPVQHLLYLLNCLYLNRWVFSPSSTEGGLSEQLCGACCQVGLNHSTSYTKEPRAHLYEYGQCCTIKAKVKEVFGQNFTVTSKSSHELAEPQEGSAAAAYHANWGQGTQVRYWLGTIQLPKWSKCPTSYQPNQRICNCTKNLSGKGALPWPTTESWTGQRLLSFKFSPTPDSAQPVVEVLQRYGNFFSLQGDQMTQDTFLCYSSTHKVSTEPPCMPLQRSGNYPLIIPTAKRVIKHSNNANRKKKHSSPNSSPLYLCF